MYPILGIHMILYSALETVQVYVASCWFTIFVPQDDYIIAADSAPNSGRAYGVQMHIAI